MRFKNFIQKYYSFEVRIRVALTLLLLIALPHFCWAQPSKPNRQCPEYFIQMASPWDFPQIRDILTEAFPNSPPYEEAAFVAERFHVAATESGAVIGTVNIQPPRKKVPYSILWDLAVRPENNGFGVGTALVRRAQERAEGEKVYLLTEIPDYFLGLDFRIVRRHREPRTLPSREDVGVDENHVWMVWRK